MDWIHSIQEAINYIENNLFDNIHHDEIAKNVYSSNFHFQKIFRMITGVTMGEYTRNRRLSLAGKELYEKKSKVIDIALKYGYESPESFTKAFIRFHGITPSYARKSDKELKTFNSISVQINMKGSDILDYKIEVKDEFIGSKSKKLSNISVKFNDTWEETLSSDFMNSLVAVMHNIDQSIDTTYVAGVSGAAFNTYWSFGTNNCCDILLMGDKFIEKTFKNLGYYYTHYKKGVSANWDNIKSKIVESIDYDIPVLIRFKDGYGVISGYDKNGRMLDGDKCYYEDEYGCFPREDYDIIDNVIIINGKNHDFTRKELLIDSLAWDIHMLNLQEFFNYENGSKCINGIACYDEVIHVLQNDALFPDRNEYNPQKVIKYIAALSERQLALYGGYTENYMDHLRGMCEEVFNNFIQYNVYKRKFAPDFLCMLAKEFPICSEELEKAAASYDKVYELYKEAFTDAPLSWLPDEKIMQTKETSYRNKIASILSEIKEQEISGVSYMERALKKIAPAPVKYAPAL